MRFISSALSAILVMLVYVVFRVAPDTAVMAQPVTAQSQISRIAYYDEGGFRITVFHINNICIVAFINDNRMSSNPVPCPWDKDEEPKKEPPPKGKP